MTVIVTAACFEGAAMASDSQTIIMNNNLLKTNPKSKDFKVAEGREPKIYVLGGKYGLAYSGVSGSTDTTTGKDLWDIRKFIKALDEMAMNGANLHQLAHSFKEALDDLFTAMPHINVKYSFQMAGYEDAHPTVLDCFNCGEIESFGSIEAGFRGGMVYAGEVDILSKICKNEIPDLDNYSLKELVNLVETAVRTELTFQKMFTGYRNISGPPVNVLVITPHYCDFVKYGNEDLSLENAYRANINGYMDAAKQFQELEKELDAMIKNIKGR